MATDQTQICVTPLSSLYGLLPRTHTYALVAALFAPLPQGWLFRAALATFTARTAVVAVDAAVLLSRLQRQTDSSPLPLDVLPVAELLAHASIVAVWLLVCSERMARSSARPLVVAWAVVVAIGTILAFVGLKLLGRAVTRTVESAMVCPAGSVAMLRLDVLGAEETLGAGIGLVGDKVGWFLLRVGVLGVLFAALAFLACMVPTTIKSQNSDAVAGMGGLQSELVEQQTRSSYGKRVGHVLAYVFVLAMPALAVFVAVSAEQRLLGVVGSPVPVVESIQSVDQWSVWAATGVVLLATLINAAREQTGSSSAGGVAVETSPEIFKV